MLIPARAGDSRSPERIYAHYLVERRLADCLRAACCVEERQRISSQMYAELFRLVPDHPRLSARGATQGTASNDLDWDHAFLARFIDPQATFMEIGAGDCALSRRMARHCRKVYAVDLCDQTRGAELPANVQLVISNGCDIDVPARSVQVAFSDQLMEHLHPDDALEQLRNIERALSPDGVYLCITPNRLYGPSDVSGHFCAEPRGFHLHEYTLAELTGALQAARFARVVPYVGCRGLYFPFSRRPLLELERLLARLPYPLRRRLADTKLLRPLLGLRVAAYKAANRS
jgi:2-polyprenyl-3-methyl-5-hydroxy-6-metoxy-1,4-benzoquinol methylase